VAGSHTYIGYLICISVPYPTTPVPPSEVSGTCPDSDWIHYGSDCFLFRPDSWHTWEEAKEDCASYGSFLTIVRDQSENWFVHNQLQQNTNLPFGRPSWIGFAKEKGGEHMNYLLRVVSLC